MDGSFADAANKQYFKRARWRRGWHILFCVGGVRDSQQTDTGSSQASRNSNLPVDDKKTNEGAATLIAKDQGE
jgi:hypothetical protein